MPNCGARAILFLLGVPAKNSGCGSQVAGVGRIFLVLPFAGKGGKLSENLESRLKRIEAELMLSQTVLSQLLNALDGLPEIALDIQTPMDTLNILRERIDEYEKEN
jgi:hypothetical protein